MTSGFRAPTALAALGDIDPAAMNLHIYIAHGPARLLKETPIMLPNPSHPDEPITAVCRASYLTDRIPAFAFIFRVENTRTRFTVYATEQHRWLINSTYVLTISEPDHVPLCLSADEAAFLRHSLDLLAQRWREAITEAETGAQLPPSDTTPSPGHLTIEPTTAGYRAIVGRFRDELHRVTTLAHRLDQLQPTAAPDAGPATATDVDGDVW